MRQRMQPSQPHISAQHEAPPLTVQQAATRLGQSEEWIRSRFERVPGTLIVPAPPRRGKRGYNRMLIPVSVFEATLNSWSVR
jgi:hypothetical protein